MQCARTPKNNNNATATNNTSINSSNNEKQNTKNNPTTTTTTTTNTTHQADDFSLRKALFDEFFSAPYERFKQCLLWVEQHPLLGRVVAVEAVRSTVNTTIVVVATMMIIIPMGSQCATYLSVWPLPVLQYLPLAAAWCGCCSGWLIGAQRQQCKRATDVDDGGDEG